MQRKAKVLVALVGVCVYNILVHHVAIGPRPSHDKARREPPPLPRYVVQSIPGSSKAILYGNRTVDIFPYVDLRQYGDPPPPLPISKCSPWDTIHFNLETECINYLTNLSNVASLVPLSSIRLTQRTIKFLLTYKEPNLQAILKVPQDKFMLEPYSEFTAHRLDRILGINSVPPTGWANISTRALRKSVKARGDDKYSTWLDEAFFDFARKRRFIKNMTSPSGVEERVGVSIQLWMNEVRLISNIEGLHLFKGNWFAWFDPNRTQAPAATRDISYMAGLHDITLLDYLMGNNDRTFDHNGHGVGSCARKCRVERLEKRHWGPPAFISVDQGSSFYRSDMAWPETNPLVFVRYYNATFCRFRNSTIRRLNQLAAPEYAIRFGDLSYLATKNFSVLPVPSLVNSSRIYRLLQQNVPTYVYFIIGRKPLLAVQQRLHMVLHQVELCIHRYGIANTLVL